ncbi:MAG: FtsX-like permease family protein, partial [Pseudomonadota bacterium]
AVATASIISLTVFGLWLGKEDKAVLFSNLNASEASLVLEELAKQDVTAELAAGGTTVNRITVPAPGEHPHNSQMMTLLFILEAFGLLALLLSGLLVATMISALMERQVRQIGVMKSFGARRMQIAGIYLGTVIFLGMAALIIGIPAGLAAGRAYAAFAASTLNFEIASNRVDLWVIGLQIAAALLIPIVGAAFPIYRGSRVTVREAISDDGASENAIGTRPIDALLGRVQGGRRTLLLGLRNTFRRQRRLALTLLALAAGGAVFMTALNVGASWNKTTEAEFAARRFDVSIRLPRLYPSDQLESVLGDLPGVVDLETWLEADTSLIYPNGDNGELFRTAGLPADTAMVAFPLLEGRWLRPADENALVVSHGLADTEPSMTVGSEVVLELKGQATKWTVVGVVRQIGPAVAYANREAFAGLAGVEGQTNQLLIAADVHSAAGQ